MPAFTRKVRVGVSTTTELLRALWRGPYWWLVPVVCVLLPAAVVFIGYGVGMGLILNGQVYHGPTGAAAEFGHMNHLPGGPLCRCGRRGCVEAYAADYSILRWASGHADRQLPSFTAIPAGEMQALEEGDLRDWKKEYILNFTEWVLDDKQEYYGGGYTLDYEFALNMEVFMGLFRPTHTRSSHQ